MAIIGVSRMARQSSSPSGFVVQRVWATAAYDDTEEFQHTAANGYQCADPDCICHDAEEADYHLQITYPGPRLSSYYAPDTERSA